MTNVLKQNASEVERTLLGVGAEVVRTFTAKADEMTGAVANKAGEIARLLDDRSSNLLVAIESKSRTLVSEITRVTDQTVSSIESRGVSTARALVSNSEEISRLINDASNNASVSLTRQLRELQEQARSAVDQSQRTSSAAVSEMHETHNMLRTDVNSLFERLREANTLLQEVLGGATENLGAIESSLSTRVAEFVAAMNDVGERSNAAGFQVDEHIKSFQAMSSNVLREISALAEQFDAHGHALAAAASLVDKSNLQIKETLGDSRTSIDGLVSELTAKTENLSEAVTGKTAQLSAGPDGEHRTVERGPGRQDRGRHHGVRRPDRSARTASQAVRRPADRVVRNLGSARARHRPRDRRGEHRRHPDDRRTVRARTDDLRGGKPTHHRAVARPLRAGDRRHRIAVQADRGAVRPDPRRSEVNDRGDAAGAGADARAAAQGHPGTAAGNSDSAAQMRRVIVDQIEALAELNRIVARHGRGIDATENARRNAVREDAVVAGAGRGSVVRPVTPPPENRAPAAPPPRQQAPRHGLRPLPATAAPAGSPISSRGPRATSRKRRSRTVPVPARESQPASESNRSNSISVDIARMIDHDAAAELWDRYKRGERNVFTRRLYTLQGQQTFDEIRKRYRADREFKQTVDRYIGEFERLLEEVSRDDRGSVVAKNYLTSETGKVYTMLAHAAGRFD